MGVKQYFEELHERAEYKLFSKIRLATNGCLEWQGWVGSNGYGEIEIAKKFYFVHRYFYMLWGGSLSDNLCVLHKCDNRICVNPAHLFLGTRNDNNKDRANKNRSFRQRGALSPKAKLSSHQVVEIRKKLLNKVYGIGNLLANEYEVSPSIISLIKCNRHYKEV